MNDPTCAERVQQTDLEREQKVMRGTLLCNNCFAVLLCCTQLLLIQYVLMRNLFVDELVVLVM